MNLESHVFLAQQLRRRHCALNMKSARRAYGCRPGRVAVAFWWIMSTASKARSFPERYEAGRAGEERQPAQMQKEVVLVGGARRM